MTKVDELIGRLRSSAKAFRENTVYDSEGDPLRLIVQANECDEAAAALTDLQAQVAKAEAEAWAKEQHAAADRYVERVRVLEEALDIAWREASKWRKASELVGPYPNDPKATKIWALSLYHAGKDLMEKLKPARTALENSNG